MTLLVNIVRNRMANLIITIISIALVAVAALMGAYYGGAAFLEGQTKARVNAIINDMDQIKAAMVARAVNNGGDYSIAIVPSPGLVVADWSTLVNEKYLASEPLSKGNQAATPAYICGYYVSFATGGYGDFNDCGAIPSNSIGFFLAGVDENTCKQARRMVNSGVFTSHYDMTTGNINALLGIGTGSEKAFECYSYDDSINGLIDGGQHYFIVRRFK